MQSFQEIKHVVLKDKRQIILNDEGAFSLSVVWDKKELFRYPMDYPEAGYGGGALFLSPDNSYLLFAYYSGQSEEGFALFKIGDDLEMVYHAEYMCGEAASYCFSGDETILVQCLPLMSSEWWQLADESEEDEQGRCFFEYGYVSALNIEKKVISRQTVRIYPSDSWQCTTADYRSLMLPKVIDRHHLNITMPWGQETICLPLENTVSFQLG